MTKRIVLIVDDDPMFFLLMERVFRSLDVQTAGATTVEDSLRLARELRPVLIIMDVYLPGGDGWTTALCIKNEFEPVHIIVVSAGGIMVDKAKIAEFKCTGFFKKPFGITEFIAFVKPLLE